MTAPVVDPADLRTTKQAAKKLGLSEADVVRLIEANTFRAKRAPNGTYYVDKAAIKAFKQASGMQKSVSVAEAAQRIGIREQQVRELVGLHALIEAPAPDGSTRLSRKSVRQYARFKRQTERGIEKRRDREQQARQQTPSQARGKLVASTAATSPC
jgi:hypothetical protein